MALPCRATGMKWLEGARVSSHVICGMFNVARTGNTIDLSRVALKKLLAMQVVLGEWFSMV